MSDVLTINSTAINLAATTTTLDSCTPFVKGGIPELHFTRLVGKLAALPDPWSGKSCSLTMLSGTLVFSGDVQGYVDRYMDQIGWVREYRALGLLNRANYIPVTDAITLTDTAIFNLPGDDPNFIGARAGLTVGAIVAEVLTMAENAGPLHTAGIGNYTSLGPPAVLPSITTTDLAALTIIPQWRVQISGERILQALEGFVQSCHPNHFLHVDPSGNIRFLDVRTFSNNTLTLGGDPRLLMPQLTRDYSDCYSQVLVRGNTLCQAVKLQDQPWPGSSASDGGLAEDFGYGSTSNAAAKAAWVPSDWSQPNVNGDAYDIGTCTCPSTTTVTVTSSNASMTWAANALDQSGLLGTIQLFSDSLGGLITQVFQARIISNTALAAGGSSTLTLDIPMPSLTYQSYQIFGLAAGENVVGRRYRVTNSAIASAIQNYFPYPFAYVNSTDTAASLTTTPIGTVTYSPTGGTTPPFAVGMDGITIDPVNGFIYFNIPVQVVSGGLNTPVRWPQSVQVFVPVATGTLIADAPGISPFFSGTLYAVEGIERTKTVTVSDWRDIGNQATMDTYASELLDSMKDVVIEGTLPYAGLLSAYLAPGQAVSIAGTSGSTAYTTGFEGLALPVVSAEITFNSGSAGTSYMMVLHLSNRRGRYSAANYLRPNITGAQFFGGLGETFGAKYAPSVTASQQYANESSQQLSANKQSSAEWNANFAAKQFTPENTGTQAGNASNQLTQAGSADNQLTQAGSQDNQLTQAGSADNQLTIAGLGQAAVQQAIQGGQAQVNQQADQLGQMIQQSNPGVAFDLMKGNAEN